MSGYACGVCVSEGVQREKKRKRESDKEVSEVVLGVDEVPPLWWPGEAWV